ncbi:cysteine desulfurase-like protein [Streptomyces sp. ID03-2B]|uniref:Cysteine desulfurase-like protein n=1 Tax=Streptomyces caviscabies TaxID=90079 RepID=A0ABW2MAS8_9ACTN|nr:MULTISPECIES: cysteine desulfurase-like protein [unclassified Streptomyces]MCL6288709.1 cysteine desulfurase-like protein [Streptomyces sp. 43Y-GA-1]MDX3502479.1 cysteine desulfurase-like protein [Streptomyces sp. ATCC51928]MDX3590138.1 cysteine desulfurase-like protein [Streptomyces sp. ID03-2B]MDX5522510.1 cysteine desulfurase-like protein [Streptomyces sp. DE06-01C]
MSYDIGAVRAQFPALRSGTAHFDGPGGTQTPVSVIAAIGEAMSRPLSIRGAALPGEVNAEEIVLGFRQAMADLLGADPGGIVYGRSATQLTYDFSRTLSGSWNPGDEVVVSRLDHDANIRPWVRAAERAGAVVRWADFDPATGELPPETIGAQLTERTRLVAVTGASNLIGTRPDIPAVAGLVHRAGALLYVDGVHLTAHHTVDVERLGADFFVCSPYKFFGPHHGVLAARPDLLDTLRPDKLAPSTDAVPERFELGTLPYESMAGTRAAVDFLASLGAGADAGAGRRERLRSAYAAIDAHETALRVYIEKAVRELGGVTVRSRAAERTPTLLLTFEGRDAADAYRALARSGVHAPAGSFYALEASRHLGLGDSGGLRVGLSAYNDMDDVERLLTGLSDFLR